VIMPKSNLQEDLIRTIECIPISAQTSSDFTNQVTAFLFKMEELRRKLFLKVSIALSQQGLIMLQTVDENIRMELNKLRKESKYTIKLTEQQKRCYGQINIKLELLLQNCVDKLMVINTNSRNYTANQQRDNIDIFIKTLYMKFMFKHLLSVEETKISLNSDQDEIDELTQIEPFIKNNIDIEGHDIISGSLRERMMLAIKDIADENRRKTKLSFFSINQNNYRNRVKKMNRFYSELHNINALTAQEFTKKADSVIKACNRHTNIWSYIFSRKPTKTAKELQQITQSTLNQTLLNRVREDTKLIM
jgi:hypothetical protein